MKILCSYAFTGEDEITLVARLHNVVNTLQQCGHHVYCFQFEKRGDTEPTPDEALRLAIDELQSCDAIFVIKSSERRSEGQLIEVGAALAQGKRIFVAQHRSAVGTTYLPTLADASFVWDDEESLLAGICAVL